MNLRISIAVSLISLAGVRQTRAVASVELALGVVAGFVAVAIIDPGGGAPLLTAGHRPGEVDPLPRGLGVEILRPHLLAKHHVVVHVNKLLGESRNPVDVGFYCRRAECRKVSLIGENFLDTSIKYKSNKCVVMD